MTDFSTILNAYLDDELTADQRRQLVVWINEDQSNIDRFVSECHLDSCLQDVFREEQVSHDAMAVYAIHEGTRECRRQSPPVFNAFPDDSASKTEPHIPGVLPISLHGAIGYLSSGWPLAYMISTGLIGLSLFAASFVYVSHSDQTAKSQPTRPSSPAPRPSPVARVTGMIDCEFSDPQTTTFAGANAPLGRKYALSKGLMELTYDTGAKVILQGPCTYEVTSADSGHLAVGKLTARVEKKVASGKWQVASGEWPVVSAENQKSLTTDHRPLATSSSLSTIHYPLFTIETPTAVVTDLGTEFGVEVNDSGVTSSHVFRGKVRLTARNGDQSEENKSIVLEANQSARSEVVRSSDGRQKSNVIVRLGAVNSKKFIRQLIQPPKTLDILDIVAGGDGCGQHRERGIDQTTGLEITSFIDTGQRKCDSQYHRVSFSNRLIDGVFVPRGSEIPIVVDSAGHTFNGFGKASGDTFSCIWARAENPVQLKEGNKLNMNSGNWIYSTGRAEQFMPERHGLLCMHSNAGITFSLAAVRDKYPFAKPVKFHAVMGMADSQHIEWATSKPQKRRKADVWVLVDGQVKAKRLGLRPEDGPIGVEVEIKAEDRFLTLISSDAGNTRSLDWVVFGDPVLHMVAEERR